MGFIVLSTNFSFTVLTLWLDTRRSAAPFRKTRKFFCFSTSATSFHYGMEVWYGTIYTL